MTGIDGAGKSTTLSLLAQQFPDWEVGGYDPHTWLDPDKLPHLGWMLQQDPRPVVSRLEPKTRASFLGHMVLCHWESWLQPRLTSGANVLMDSFFFRFWARERVLGNEWRLFEQLVENLPSADYSIRLKISPEIAMTRKSNFDPNETGGLQEADGERTAFLNFQKKVDVELRTACQRWSLNHVEVLAEQTPERVTSEVAQALTAYQDKS